MTKPTPYDTGKRLEPRPWIQRDPGLTPARGLDDYGKVDFDNEEGSTELTTYVELSEDKSHYTLNIYNHGVDPVEIALVEDDQTALVFVPSMALRVKVQEVINDLRTGYEQETAEVYWQKGSALILVPGEKHVRRQQAIMVYANGLKPSSAIVKDWADGVRDTRIG